MKQEDTRSFDEILRDNRPQEWELLPDIELYMDQLLSYVNRQIPEQMRDQELTKSMVNNYIKQQIISRPNGKRYTRQHIAELSYIMMLKEVIPIQQCKELFDLLEIEDQMRVVYEKFQNMLDETLLDTSEKLAAMKSENSIADSALRFALISYSARRAALYLINSQLEES